MGDKGLGSYSRDLYVAVCGVAILVVVLAVLGGMGIRRLYNAQDLVFHSHRQVLGLERLMSLATDAETGQRGFLLTSDERYLEPYHRAINEFSEQFRQLEESFRYDPPQAMRLAQLKALFDAKFREIEQTIQLQRKKGLAAAQEVILTDRGKRTMDAARAKITEMGEEENKRLREREEIRAKDRSAALLTITGTGVLALVLCVGFGLLLRRHLAAQERANAERKRAEEALIDADRRKDEFLATLAHELRNPLAPLRTALQLARQPGAGTGQPAPSQDLLGMMARQVDQMVRLVDDLLDVARITRGKLALRLETTDIGTVVDHALETCAPMLDQGHHKVRLSLPPRHLLVEGDPARLSQVVCNLINNATKFSAEGGDIDLAVKEEGAAVVLCVADHGIGIPPDRIEEIFEMFTQVDSVPEASKSGLGIGLTLARQIVQMHGGTIEASSEGTGRGSQFTIRLPVSSAHDAARPAPAAAKQEDAPKMKIVIADDNRDSADSMAMLLEAGGHEVHVAYDGAQAVETAGRTHPEVVLLDIGMPKMNGFECARAIRGQPWGTGTLLIALTGWGQEEDKRRAIEAGFDRHLTKPVDPVKLEGALRPQQGASA